MKWVDVPKPTKSKSKPQPTNFKVSKTRKIKQPKYKSFRFSKKIHQPKPKLTGSFKLLKSSITLLSKKWRLFGGIVLVYLFLTVVLVKGFGVSSDIGQLKETVLGLFGGNTGQLVTGLTLFGVLLSNANSTASEVAGAYQSMLLIVVSLALIWSLRQSLAEKVERIGVKDAFYRGLYPLVPFILILMVIGLQLLPIVFSNFLYNIVFSGGLAVTVLEQVLWGMLIFLLIILSLYMITSSVFALYIVTLPNVRPMQALRSARDLVMFRRWIIMRKVIFLPVALLIIAAVIIVPIIILSPAVAEWVFFVLSMGVLAIAHSYFYHLYRELLK